MDYLKRFGQNFKCFFKGDGQKIARECQLDNFAESGRSDSRYLFLGFETGFRFRESDFKNNLWMRTIFVTPRACYELWWPTLLHLIEIDKIRRNLHFSTIRNVKELLYKEWLFNNFWRECSVAATTNSRWMLIFYSWCWPPWYLIPETWKKIFGQREPTWYLGWGMVSRLSRYSTCLCPRALDTWLTWDTCDLGPWWLTVIRCRVRGWLQSMSSWSSSL